MLEAQALPSKTKATSVLVVGLLDRQFALIADEFPQLKLSHLIADHLSEIAVKAAAADHVVLVTKFVSHAAEDNIDREKLIRVNGGIQSVRIALANIAGAPRAASNVVAIRPEAKALEALDTKIDFAALKSAKTGDELVFTRPDGMPAHVFNQRLQQARHYYKTHSPFLTTSQEISGGRGTIYVLGMRDDEAAEAPKQVAAIATPVLDAAESVLLSPDEIAFRLPTFAEQAKTFWREVYFESMRCKPFAPMADHAALANAAVAGWRLACGEK